MTSISSINSKTYLDELLAAQAGGTTQGADSATDAFASLFQSALDSQTQAQSASTPGATASPADMAALGQALSSGNLSLAQLAFQSLQSDLQTGKKHHHPAVADPATASSAQDATRIPAIASLDASDLAALLSRT